MTSLESKNTKLKAKKNESKNLGIKEKNPKLILKDKLPNRPTLITDILMLILVSEDSTKYLSKLQAINIAISIHLIS